MIIFYLWSNNSSNDTAINLVAGSYTVNVTDNNGCSASASVTITQPESAINVSANTTENLICYGGDNGIAKSFANGGTPPYTYSWSPGGETNAKAIGLSAGTYTVTVTDNTGCNASATTAITQPTPMIVVTDSISTYQTTCDGAAWVTVNGGTPPYTYSWSPGGNTTDNISNKCPGSYCCVITDANGCMDSVCIIINISTGTGNIVSNSRQITVYPNPNNGVFTIESSGLSGPSSVEIYNVLGQKLKSEELTTHYTTIDLSDKASGVYFYRVLQEDDSLLGEGKLIIEK